MKNTISGRLRTIAESVTTGNRLADIGTDHGYVPIYLVRKNRIPYAIAMDINAGPLEKARKNIQSEGLEGRIETRLSDGLKELKPYEADTILIAGMGGALTVRILDMGMETAQTAKELILSPQSEQELVRHFLHNRGYRIQEEKMIYDEKKYYNIIRAIKGQEQYSSEFEYRYGSISLQKRNPVFVEFLQKELSKRKGICEQIQKQTGHRAGARYEKLQGEIIQLQDCLEEICQS